MKRIVLPVALLLVALTWASAAAAKEVVAMKICGPDGCQKANDAMLAGLRPDGPGGGDQTTVQALAAPGPYYKLIFGVGERKGGRVLARWDAWYVAGAGVVRSGDSPHWVKPFPEYRAAFEQLAKTVEPFPKPTLTAVTVDGDPVADPNSYLALLEVDPAAAAEYPPATTTTNFEYVEMRSRRASPWTDGITRIEFLPEANLVLWDGELAQLSAEVAAAVQARRSLDLDRGFPWLVLLVAGAAVVFMAAAFALSRRGRSSPAAAPEPTTA